MNNRTNKFFLTNTVWQRSLTYKIVSNNLVMQETYWETSFTCSVLLTSSCWRFHKVLVYTNWSPCQFIHYMTVRHCWTRKKMWQVKCEVILKILHRMRATRIWGGVLSGGVMGRRPYTREIYYHSLLKGEVILFQCLFLAIYASDVTISAVLTKHNTVYMPFRWSTRFVYIPISRAVSRIWPSDVRPMIAQWNLQAT